jgi:hypothetical protein
MSELFSSPIEEINNRHAQVEGLARNALENAIRIGELLTEQKKKCKHGEWESWLAANIQFARRTVTRYMGLFVNREKLATVANLAEAYRLTMPKSDREVNSTNGEENTHRTYMRAPPKPHPANAEIVELANEGVSGPEIAERVGVSKRVVQRELEHEALKRQVKPDVARDMLSLTAQAKLDRAIEQEKARLGAQYSLDVSAKAKEFLANTIGPILQKEQREARWIMKSRHGVMTRKEFNQIRACLHGDRTPSVQEKEHAFALFTSFEKFLLREKESPTTFTYIPQTKDEWDALRKQVMEERRRKAKNKTTTITPKRG